MEKPKRIVGTSLVISIALLVTGCNLTIGPQTETRYVIVKPGTPGVILENKVLPIRALTDTEGDAVGQDIGGWVAMPPEHWDQVKADLVKYKARITELENLK